MACEVPIVALNRAAAVTMAHGPAAALELVEALKTGGELTLCFTRHRRTSFVASDASARLLPATHAR